jgi:hypothetical protein
MLAILPPIFLPLYFCENNELDNFTNKFPWNEQLVIDTVEGHVELTPFGRARCWMLDTRYWMFESSRQLYLASSIKYPASFG